MATFWERAAYSVRCMFLCFMSIFKLVYLRYWFRGQDFGSDCTSSRSSITSNLVAYVIKWKKLLQRHLIGNT